ncbi:MAG: rhodanese-like domain-containing protein [Xanthobacter sp.]
MAKLISAQDLHKKIGQGPVALIDVRTPGEFAGAHVEQAINAPLSALDPAALEQAGAVNRKKPVYLMCQTQGRSSMAASSFEKAGFRNVLVVAGGMSGWKSAGHPVVSGPGAGRARQMRLALAVVVVAGLALAWLL